MNPPKSKASTKKPRRVHRRLDSVVRKDIAEMIRYCQRKGYRDHVKYLRKMLKEDKTCTRDSKGSASIYLAPSAGCE